MIVASQDGTRITENIEFYIEKQKVGEKYLILNHEDFFGIYETKERAKEVLKEIIKKYSSYLKIDGGPAILKGQIDIQPNIFNIPKVYKMPEK